MGTIPLAFNFNQPMTCQPGRDPARRGQLAAVMNGNLGLVTRYKKARAGNNDPNLVTGEAAAYSPQIVQNLRRGSRYSRVYARVYIPEPAVSLDSFGVFRRRPCPDTPKERFTRSPPDLQSATGFAGGLKIKSYTATSGQKLIFLDLRNADSPCPGSMSL
jgi:hypothetical protein